MNNNPIVKKIEKLHHRLFKAGIYVSFALNYPWIYLDSVNTKKVKETYHSEYGFVVGYMTERRFVNLPLMFETIRKYL